MLTEKQFKALLQLFDEEGHAGWELAKKLEMEESNLNPLLKKLEKKKFIAQGQPRKSEKIKKREGDYKEIPYYLTRDLGILGTLIKEMVVTNEFTDTGFPFRIIETSKYMKSMQDKYGQDYWRCLAELSKKSTRIEGWAEAIEMQIRHEIKTPSPRPKKPNTFKDKRLTKKSLGELEKWWNEQQKLRDH